MINIELDVELKYTVLDPSAHFLFLIHAANTPQQHVRYEHLHIGQPGTQWMLHEPQPGLRCLRVTAAQGPLSVRYAATVEIQHYAKEPCAIAETLPSQLPLEVLPYVYPSRYCQSDQLAHVALKEFGHIPPGCLRVQAICEWVRNYVTFRSNSSTSTTSAVDTLVERVGVCRDFAHLMIALCRALNLPARMVTGTDYGADPNLGPPDFHAYVEVFLGNRWYLFDPSGVAIPQGMVRLATGRDAADVAFATIFGRVLSEQPLIKAQATQDAGHGWELPAHTNMALSTERFHHTLPGSSSAH